MNARPSGAEPDLSLRFLTISNILSLCRVFMVVPFIIVMVPPSPGGRIWGAAIMLIAALTDWLDGYTARKFRKTSEWGKVLDPLADKIAVLAVLIVLLLSREIPLWFAALGVSRDVLIVTGGILIRHRYGVILPSNEFGRWTMGSTGLTLFLLVIGQTGFVVDFFLTLSSLMMILSFVFYMKRAVGVFRNGEAERNGTV